MASNSARLALPTLQTLSREMSQAPDVLIMLAEAFVECKQYDNAMQICSGLLRQNGSSPSVLVRPVNIYRISF